jgi:hypothetical protein
LTITYKFGIIYSTSNEHAQGVIDTYKAPLLAGGIGVLELGGLAVANLVAEVPESYNTIATNIGGCTVIGAIGAAIGIAAGIINRRS